MRGICDFVVLKDLRWLVEVKGSMMIPCNPSAVY